MKNWGERMTMINCIKCGIDAHISEEDYWKFTFEDIDKSDLEEKGLCEECFQKERQTFIEQLLTDEQKVKLDKFESLAFKRFEHEVKQVKE